MQVERLINLFLFETPQQESLSMSGPIVRTGTTPEFWRNYDQVFGVKSGGKKKAAGKKASTKKKAAKKAAKKKAVKKASKKKANKKAGKKK